MKNGKKASPKNVNEIEAGKDHLKLDSAKSRQTAKALLPTVQSIEEKQKANGWRWMQMGKTSKLVSPQNQPKRLSEGYFFVKSNKKR